MDELIHEVNNMGCVCTNCHYTFKEFQGVTKVISIYFNIKRKVFEGLFWLRCPRCDLLIVPIMESMKG